MGYLDSFFKLLVDVRNAGVAIATRKVLNFSSEFTCIDNPSTGAIDIFTTGGSPIAVPNTRQIIAGAGMLATPAGSDLTVDRTHDIVAGDASIQVNPDSITVGVLQNDTQHGVLGGGGLHALASGSSPGFMSVAHFNDLTNATATPTASRIAKWGTSIEMGAAFFYVGSSLPTIGDFRTENNTTAWAARSSGGINMVGLATNVSNELLFGVDTGATVGTTVVRSRVAIPFRVALATPLSLGATVADFAALVKLPASSPTAVREVGADNTTGRALVFVDGASRSVGILATVSATKTANYTAAWDETVRVDPSGGAFTVTLPTASGNAGRILTVVNVTDSFVPVTVDGAGSETINGQLTQMLAEPRAVMVLQSDGTNVHILNRPYAQAKLTTASDTPVDILTFALPLNSMTTIYVEASAKDSTGATVAEWRARNSWQRTSGGTSTRVGTANGTQDSVANQFAITRPSITFGDPTVSNNATVIATGKLATTVNWHFNFRYHQVL